VSTEAVGNVSKDPSPILELNPEHSIGKDFDNPTCSQIGRLGHEPSLYLKFGRFNHPGAHGNARRLASARKPLFAVIGTAGTGEDARAFAGDRDGVLEVGRQ
jgi:hypothetical protein